MIGQYRKKPIVIEAVQCQVGRATTISEWMKSHGFSNFTWDGHYFHIETLEGTMKAGVFEQDWIIRGIKGEFYPCKADIFAATYEEVNQ